MLVASLRSGRISFQLFDKQTGWLWCGEVEEVPKLYLTQLASCHRHGGTWSVRVAILKVAAGWDSCVFHPSSSICVTQPSVLDSVHRHLSINSLYHSEQGKMTVVSTLLNTVGLVLLAHA